MNDLSHHVTQFNCGGPCRHSPPPDVIHPYLSEVNIDTSLIRSMINSTSGDTSNGTINGGKEFLQSIELIESSDNPPAPARVAARDACVCGHSKRDHSFFGCYANCTCKAYIAEDGGESSVCPDCGHGVSIHTDGGWSGFTCCDGDCYCALPFGVRGGK